MTEYRCCLCAFAQAQNPPEPKWVEGEVLVKFKVKPNKADYAGQFDKFDDIGLGIHHIKAKGKKAADLVEVFKKNPNVEEVSLNYISHTTIMPNDPYYCGPYCPGSVYNVSTLGLPAAWDITTGSSSIGVGVLDTGIDATHLDTYFNLWSAPTPFTVTVGGQPITCPAGSHGIRSVNSGGTIDCNTNDDVNHGTHVSGIIGARGNNGIGIAGYSWYSTIIPIKVCYPTSSGGADCPDADVINGLSAIRQLNSQFGLNVRVLNASFGGWVPMNPMVRSAIAAANADNMLFVAAAGNGLIANNDIIPFYPANFSVDPETPYVVSVGGAAKWPQGETQEYSFGPHTVDIFAPAEAVSLSVEAPVQSLVL